MSIRTTPWLLFPALAAVVVIAPALNAQEVEPPGAEEQAAEGQHLGMLVGLRVDFLDGLPAPGASVDLVISGSGLWVSLQFLAQMVRWKLPRGFSGTGRADHYVGRVRLGLGTGQGPSVYGLVETGRGIVQASHSKEPGTVSRLTGLGLGAGFTFQRVTASAETVLGEANYPHTSPFGGGVEFYGSLAVSLQFRLGR